jgi:hypothetical protein
MNDETRGPARTGVAISALLALGLAALFILVLRGSPLPQLLGFATALALFVFLYGCLVSYVYADARRRGMRAGVWATLAALIPHALGFIAYFLLREPLLQRCTGCGTAARSDLAFCPQCGTPLRRICTACRRPVEAAWGHCAHCGTKLVESALSASA